MELARIIELDIVEMFQRESWKPIYLGSKGQRSRSRGTKKTVPACVFALLWVPDSSSLTLYLPVFGLYTDGLLVGIHIPVGLQSMPKLYIHTLLLYHANDESQRNTLISSAVKR